MLNSMYPLRYARQDRNLPPNLQKQKNMLPFIITLYIILTGISILVGKNWPKIEKDVGRPPIFVSFIPITAIIIIGIAIYLVFMEKIVNRLDVFWSGYITKFKNWYYNDQRF